MSNSSFSLPKQLIQKSLDAGGFGLRSRLFRLRCRGFRFFHGFPGIFAQLPYLFFQAGQAVLQIGVIIPGPQDVPFHAADFFFQQQLLAVQAQIQSAGQRRFSGIESYRTLLQDFPHCSTLGEGRQEGCCRCGNHLQQPSLTPQTGCCTVPCRTRPGP